MHLFTEHTHTRNLDEIRRVTDVLAGGALLDRPARRIGLLGHSRGGGEAVLAAAADPRVNALVTWAAIATCGPLDAGAGGHVATPAATWRSRTRGRSR